VNLIRRPALLLLLALGLGACGKKIGDECKTAFDCNQTDETRTCDISQPGGYCIIEGCDQGSCPDEAACVRFFPRLYLQTACTTSSECGNDGVCVADDAGTTKKCAPMTSEIRRCVLTCDGDNDCRDGYECRASGSYGSIALTGDGSGVRFCSPRAP
jgi:hypothetical protein